VKKGVFKLVIYMYSHLGVVPFVQRWIHIAVNNDCNHECVPFFLLFCNNKFNSWIFVGWMTRQNEDHHTLNAVIEFHYTELNDCQNKIVYVQELYEMKI